MILSKMLREIGCDFQLISDGEFEVLEQCTRIRSPKALTFLEKIKFAPSLSHPDISCVLCTPEALPMIPAHVGGVAVLEAPKTAFFKIHNYLYEHREMQPTEIDPSAQISPLAYVAPCNVRIGRNVVVAPFAVINENSILEDDVRVGSHTVIGAQSYTVVDDGPNARFMARDFGKTILRRGVEISSASVVECGTLQNDVTDIGEYCMLDNNVLIGHGTPVGRMTEMVGGTVLAGNCVIGERVWLGVSSTLSNRVEIGDRARVSLGSVVTKNVPGGETVTGNFAIEHKRFMENLKASIR